MTITEKQNTNKDKQISICATPRQTRAAAAGPPRPRPIARPGAVRGRYGVLDIFVFITGTLF